MDLRSIINDSSDSSAPKQAAPVTPVQAHPLQGFRDYSHPPQASPGKHPSLDYGVQPPGAPYAASPNTYQGNYQGRPPPPPPIQALPQNDLRSPARSYSGQSPYQHTPSSSTSQYPFPQSPAQPHQYPASLQQRDSYSHANPPPPPPPPPQIHPQNSYHRRSPPPQTPPIGMPGAPHPYIQHQRSQSSISNSTPTSAQSQQQYFNQYQQDSPVSGGHFPPSQIPQHQRQPSLQSQPGTPLGPPLTQRPSTGSYPQPSSPYQQRGLSSGSYSQYPHTSPAPPAPASIPRLPSTPSAYDSQRTSVSEQHRRSQSERERSLSVSPKTRLPSQPRGDTITPKSENGYLNATKRKMDDREMSVDEGRRVAPPEINHHINGDNRIPSSSPQQPPRKRIRYTEPPIWAQSVRAKGAYAASGRPPATTNGKQPAVQAVAAPVVKHEPNGNAQPPAPPVILSGGDFDPQTAKVQAILGPWEKSITGQQPFQEVERKVADFIYLNVLNREDIGELTSRGVQVEIEAKLGQLIDKDTNVRYHIPVETECILADLARVGFKSSMTEAQHRAMNDFLNKQVAATHPNNPTSRGRVKIEYSHTYETDSFYELPAQQAALLPAAVRQLLNARHAPKVRITRNKKTGDVIAKIIKARVNDLNIFSPQSPLDCRISINLEMKYEGDIDDFKDNQLDRSPDRNKDRLSYKQGHYQLDLTQVTQTTSFNGVNRTEKEHELEIELDTRAVVEQGHRLASGQPNEYPALVDAFLDNVRVLQRNLPHQ